jgi:dephospho-CoA kinase
VARRPLAVAITGGIAAGKSEALAAFARHGAAVASSDAIVHEIYRDDEELGQALRARWGEAVFDGDGGVDRRAVARIVFADRAELDWLEQELHPRVARRYQGWIEELRALDDPPALAVVEVPLLYEGGAEGRFDKVLVVTASPEARRARRPQTDAREERLLPDEEKQRRADFAYVNDGSLADLDRFVADVIGTLTQSSS